MYLLAISGGPDSMFLLNKYKNRKIVVAHVNYHKREDSNIDENIVRDFCKDNNIPLEVLNVKNKPEGNFQTWARNVRYDFFKEIYDKYKCDKLLTAHHKDDFIETALMQQESKRIPRYFGIRGVNEIKGMNIERPFIDIYFKEDILKLCQRKGIRFATDSSNAQPIFERNKIRLELDKKSRKEKQDLFSWFVMSNKILKKKFAKVDILIKKWSKTNYSLKFFRKLDKLKEEVVFETIHSKYDDIKLTSKKISSIIDFINGSEGNKEFKINSKHSIKKQKGFLIF